MDKLYENIAKFRRDNHLTMTDLAKLVGYNTGTMITHIEQGKVDLQYSKILKFAEAFRVSVPELEGFTDSNKFIELMECLPEDGRKYMQDALRFAVYTYGVNNKNNSKGAVKK